MITSHIEILDQASSYLREVSAADYIEIRTPEFMSSTGGHVRHILDHYSAIMTGIASGTIDYTIRNRRSDLERDPRVALDEIARVQGWLGALGEEVCDRPVALMTEVSVTERQIVTVPTTVARELVFAASHAVHHYAILRLIARSQGYTLDARFGVAPETATELRAVGTG